MVREKDALQVGVYRGSPQILFPDVCLLATTLISVVDPGGLWELDTIPETLKGYRCLPLGHSDWFMGSLSETRYLAAPRA